MKRIVQIGLLLILVAAGLLLYQAFTSTTTTVRALPTPFVVSGGPRVTPQVLGTSAAAVLPQKTVPAPIIRTLGDEAALRAALEGIKQLKYENFKDIDSLKAGGTATVSQNRYGLTDFNGNPMPGNVFTMTYRSVYVLQIHGGTDDTLFWQTANVKVDNWQEQTSIDPNTGGQIITRTAQVTAQFTLPICFTSIEKLDKESFTLQTERPSDEVAWFLAKLNRSFSPEAIISEAEAAARADALNENHVTELYQAVAADAAPSGRFYNWLKTLVFAQNFGFRAVQLDITVDPKQQIRCDGTPIQ